MKVLLYTQHHFYRQFQLSFNYCNRITSNAESQIPNYVSHLWNYFILCLNFYKIEMLKYIHLQIFVRYQFSFNFALFCSTVDRWPHGVWSPDCPFLVHHGKWSWLLPKILVVRGYLKIIAIISLFLTSSYMIRKRLAAKIVVQVFKYYDYVSIIYPWSSLITI